MGTTDLVLMRHVDSRTSARLHNVRQLEPDRLQCPLGNTECGDRLLVWIVDVLHAAIDDRRTPGHEREWLGKHDRE